MINKVAFWFNQGGSFMWVILVVFAAAWAVILERIIYYYFFANSNGAKLSADVAKALNNNNIEEAKKVASRRKAPVNMLVKTAVESYSNGMNIDEIQENIEQASIRELPKLTQRLNYLSLFGNIGTLLGLLGTISGIQVLFSSLAMVEASQKAAMLAKGIAEAMNTTAFGLIVAIPSMILYTFLFNRQKNITKDLDESVVKVVSYMKKKLEK